MIKKLYQMISTIYLLGIWLSTAAYATDSTGVLPLASPNLQTFGTVKIQFDYNITNVQAVGIAPSQPSSLRVFLPYCPQGTNAVSGINQPALPQKDYSPDFPYCRCFCKNDCSKLQALTSGITGNSYNYSATVTCGATLEGWFPSNAFTSVGTNPGQLPDYSQPGQYYYCQMGSCSTNPLPANLNFNVPAQNYFPLDFLNCSIINMPYNPQTGTGNPYGVGNCGAPSP